MLIGYPIKTVNIFHRQNETETKQIKKVTERFY